MNSNKTEPTDGTADTPVVSLFAIPKPFDEQSGRIQRNAIRSWSRLKPEMEIILFGKGNALRELADESAAKLLPIRENENGTPVLSDAFSQVHRIAQGDLLLYANSDMLFGHDLIAAVHRLRQAAMNSFLAIGQRTNIQSAEELPAGDGRAWSALFENAKNMGWPSSIVCKDYFLFTRDLYQSIPDLLVGRGNWDNWMVHSAKRGGVPVIDLSRVVMAVHPEHGHHHVPGGRRAAYVTGGEAKHNQRLCGGRHLISGSTATWRLTEGGLARIRFPRWAFVKDLPRFLTLMRNLMFFRYFFALSPFFG